MAAQTTAEGNVHIAVVDAARGLAALYVVFSHLEGAYGLSQLFPGAHFLLAIFADYAQQAVIAFFLLSGFSIHYSSAGRPLNTRPGINRYYFLRVRRICPIFVVAILIALLLGAMACGAGAERACADISHLSPTYVAQNLLFLSDRKYVDGIIVPSLPGDTPIWSLSYEVVYYLVYPAFWSLVMRFGITRALGVGAAVSAAALASSVLWRPNHLGNVFGLYVLWCLGAWVADYRRRGESVTWPPWLHFLACYVAAQSVWVLEYGGLGVVYDWLWGLLFFGLMTAHLLPRDDRRGAVLTIAGEIVAIAVGLAVIMFAASRVSLARDPEFFQLKVFGTASIFVLLALRHGSYSLAALTRNGLAPFIAAGAISYAIYLVHFPLIRYATSLGPAFPLSHPAGLLVVLTLTLVLAYVLERAFQPFANRWLGRLWRTGRPGAAGS